MGKQTGFLEYERVNGEIRKPLDRIKDFKEFHKELDSDEVANQGARCMDCGVPFCQGSCTIAGMSVGCPLQNLVPETNDLVYQGNLKLAYERLTKTHCFPEFTSRVCPALCENACSCDLHSEAVATKENERVIIENAFRKGYVK